jgi:polyphosphate kinase 2 (PPK2 family)
MGRLNELDLSLKLSREEEAARLEAASNRLLELRLTLGGLLGDGRLGPPVCVVFEGWDASGKGGAIRRHHFLWRFWSSLPGWGGMAVLDRSWYGRVLVERVEGFATPDQWTRGYDEIVEFERSLVLEGMILLKFWMHISDEEQLRRFKRRETEPLKTWKLTDEDWRNREKRTAYEQAIEDMLERTDHPLARWHLVEADSKRYARVRVVETAIAEIERGMRDRGFEPPSPRPRPAGKTRTTSKAKSKGKAEAEGGVERG